MDGTDEDEQAGKSPCSDCGGTGWKDRIVGFTESTLTFHVDGTEPCWCDTGRRRAQEQD